MIIISRLFKFKKQYVTHYLFFLVLQNIEIQLQEYLWDIFGIFNKVTYTFLLIKVLMLFPNIKLLETIF